MKRSCKAMVVVVLAASVAGCGSGTAQTTQPRQLTVAAAASLTEAFTAIGEGFEAANPGVEVTFTFDSSGTLRTQILEGAPVDVFASADEETMAELAAEERIDGAPEVFARNELAIVTKPGNPEGIAGLADLADAGVVALCAPDAPCGAFAADALADADVRLDESSVTRGQNAKATLTAVAEGDAVAGIVYVTDGEAAGGAVEVVEVADEVDVVARYPIAVLSEAGDPELAASFAAYVTSPDGQAVLEEHGFLPPS